MTLYYRRVLKGFTRIEKELGAQQIDAFCVLEQAPADCTVL